MNGRGGGAKQLYSGQSWALKEFDPPACYVLPTPLLLGLVLGPMLEGNLRRAMLTGRSDPTIS